MGCWLIAGLPARDPARRGRLSAAGDRSFMSWFRSCSKPSLQPCSTYGANLLTIATPWREWWSACGWSVGVASATHATPPPPDGTCTRPHFAGCGYVSAPIPARTLKGVEPRATRGALRSAAPPGPSRSPPIEPSGRRLAGLWGGSVRVALRNAVIEAVCLILVSAAVVAISAVAAMPPPPLSPCGAPMFVPPCSHRSALRPSWCRPWLGLAFGPPEATRARVDGAANDAAINAPTVRR